MPVVIETEEENARMLAVVEKLMKKGENLSLEEEKLLKVPATLDLTPYRDQKDFALLQKLVRKEKLASTQR